MKRLYEPFYVATLLRSICMKVGLTPDDEERIQKYLETPPYARNTEDLMPED